MFVRLFVCWGEGGVLWISFFVFWGGFPSAFFVLFFVFVFCCFVVVFLFFCLFVLVGVAVYL